MLRSGLLGRNCWVIHREAEQCPPEKGQGRVGTEGLCWGPGSCWVVPEGWSLLFPLFLVLDLPWQRSEPLVHPGQPLALISLVPLYVNLKQPQKGSDSRLVPHSPCVEPALAKSRDVWERRLLLCWELSWCLPGKQRFQPPSPSFPGCNSLLAGADGGVRCSARSRCSGEV